MNESKCITEILELNEPTIGCNYRPHSIIDDDDTREPTEKDMIEYLNDPNEYFLNLAVFDSDPKTHIGSEVE